MAIKLCFSKSTKSQLSNALSIMQFEQKVVILENLKFKNKKRIFVVFKQKVRENEKKWKKSNIFLSVFFGIYMSFISAIDLQYDPFSFQRVWGRGGKASSTTCLPHLCAALHQSQQGSILYKKCCFFSFFFVPNENLGSAHFFYDKQSNSINFRNSCRMN